MSDTLLENCIFCVFFVEVYWVPISRNLCEFFNICICNLIIYLDAISDMDLTSGLACSRIISHSEIDET